MATKSQYVDKKTFDELAKRVTDMEARSRNVVSAPSRKQIAVVHDVSASVTGNADRSMGSFLDALFARNRAVVDAFLQPSSYDELVLSLELTDVPNAMRVAGAGTDTYLLDRLFKDYKEVYFLTDGEFSRGGIDSRVKVICLPYMGS